MEVRTLKCPNCDFTDKDEAFGLPATCPSCGAVYEKALKVRQIKQKLETQKVAEVKRPAKPKKERAERKHEDHETLYTKDGTPVLIRVEKVVVEKKRAGCLKPLLFFFGTIFLISLLSESVTSYKEYAGRSGSPEDALEYSRKAEVKRKAISDDMRRIKIERLAREGVKSVLRDPYTAKFQNQRGPCGEVNSKNGFGAYTGYQRFIYGGEETVFLENSPQFAEGAFDEAWERLCTEGAQLSL